MGYYVAFQDISSSKGLRERMIPSIYYPIFHDAHNWDHPYQTDHGPRSKIYRRK